MSVVRGQPNPNCPQFQVFGYPGADAEIVARSYNTCRLRYAGLYDPFLHAPRWIAEHIKAGELRGDAMRDGLNFVDDPQLPSADAKSHFAYSGFDRGHLAPAGDFHSSTVAMQQSFLYSNAVPQNPNHNRHIWERLESITRELAARRGELYVITGGVFARNGSWLLNGKKRDAYVANGIAIPSALFKVLVDPNKREMTAFLIPNVATDSDDPAPYQVSVREVEKATGLNFNPNLQRPAADAMELDASWVLPKVRGGFRE